MAEEALTGLSLDAVDFTFSVSALGKSELPPQHLDARVAALMEITAHHPRLDVKVTDQQLVADISNGYEVVVMGADKLAQVLDPRWYNESVSDRDAAVRRLPVVAVAPRSGVDLEQLIASAEWLNVVVLNVPEQFHEVSATAVRGGRTDWAAQPIGPQTAHNEGLRRP
jgi:hypothetical protein